MRVGARIEFPRGQVNPRFEVLHEPVSAGSNRLHVSRHRAGFNTIFKTGSPRNQILSGFFSQGLSQADWWPDIECAMDVNEVASVVVVEATAKTIAPAIRAAIRLYSSEVTPRRSAFNRLRRRISNLPLSISNR